MCKALVITALLGCLVVTAVGCQKAQAPADQPAVGPRVELAPPPAPEQPKTQPVQPQPQPPIIPPARPSSAFMRGYWDGYHGTWLAPIRWTFTDEYRQGWSLGRHDKRHGINRYPPEVR